MNIFSIYFFRHQFQAYIIVFLLILIKQFPLALNSNIYAVCVGEHHTKLNHNLLSGALRRLSQFINGVNTRTKVHNVMSTFNPYFQFHVTSFHEHV